MAARILLDLIRLRAAMSENSGLVLPEAFISKAGNSTGLKTIRELAVFRFSCRRCEDAPCIGVCPADALEKDKDGIVTRHTNLCVSCKSCVTICPFGTMMTDFFHHHIDKELLHDLNDSEELNRFIKSCPPGTAMLVERDEDPEENIYMLNEKVLIRDFIYNSEKL